MLFTRMATVFAVLAVVGGLLLILVGFLGATFPEEFPRSTGRTGNQIDTGIVYLLIGLALGVLTEISRSLRDKED